MSAPPFCERMRVEARATWEAALGRRFFREIAADSIADAVFLRDLGIECGFVDTAAAAFGYAVGKAPSMRERRHLALMLEGLVIDQDPYFAAAFERAGAPAAEQLYPTRRPGADRTPSARPAIGDWVALHAGGA